MGPGVATPLIIQLETLSQLEEASGRRIAVMFDWIIASGVGALLVMALVNGEGGVCVCVCLCSTCGYK